MESAPNSLCVMPWPQSMSFGPCKFWPLALRGEEFPPTWGDGLAAGVHCGGILRRLVGCGLPAYVINTTNKKNIIIIGHMD